MRYLFIMIALFSLTSVLVARESPALRGQMLLKGKHLSVRYETLQNKKEAWQERKQVYIGDFLKKHKHEDGFGDENHYRKERFEKRKQAFYSSLEKREAEIAKELATVFEELELLKVQFLHRYGVQMCKKEMYGGMAPKIKYKKRKISLLREYVQASRSWQACLTQVDRFDVRRMALEMRTDISEKKYDSLSSRLDKKVEKNFDALGRYEIKSIVALDTYALDYGYSVSDVYEAKILLDNIQGAR